MSTVKMDLTLTIDVLLDDGETDVSWLSEIESQTGDLSVGGYSFAVSRIEINGPAEGLPAPPT